MCLSFNSSVSIRSKSDYNFNPLCYRSFCDDRVANLAAKLIGLLGKVLESD